MSEQISKAEKLKKMKELANKIQKERGTEEGGTCIRVMSDKPDPIAVLSTGSILGDLATGVGGVPVGRIIEFYGPESSGKTTLALHVAKECQSKGGLVAFIDAEHALDSSYAQRIGVRIGETMISQPDNGEQALDILDDIVSSGVIDLVIVDSVAALTPKCEIEGEMSDANMGVQARMMAKAMRKIVAKTGKSKCTVIFINQLRMKIGVMFGNPETTTGGNSLKFYASMRVDIRKGETKDNRGIMKIKIIKNKVAPPLGVAEIPLILGQGIDLAREVYGAAKTDAIGLVQTTGGSNFYCGTPFKGKDKSGKEINLKGGENSRDPENKFAPNAEAAMAFIESCPELIQHLRDQIFKKLQEISKNGQKTQENNGETKE